MCPKHPKYRAIRVPQVCCVACWQMYFSTHHLPSDKIVGRPIRLNRQELEVKHSKAYSEVLFIGDAHLGSPQFDQDRFLRMLDYAKAHAIYVFLMGDLMEAATRTSVGAGVYEQKLSANSQFEQMAEWLKPLADHNLLLGTHRGNHEARIYEMAGFDASKALARELHIPYLGDACWSSFRVGKETYSLYTLHGRSGARFDGTALLAIERISVSFNADLVAMGHMHKCISSSVISQRTSKGRVFEFKKHLLITGHYLKYDGGYAQTLGLPMGKLGSPKVKFFAEKRDIHTSW